MSNGFDARERVDRVEADADLARRQGAADAHIVDNTRRLDAINGSIEKVEGDMSSIKTEIATLKAKVGLWSAAGGLIGAGVVSFVVGGGP